MAADPARAIFMAALPSGMAAARDDLPPRDETVWRRVAARPDRGKAASLALPCQGVAQAGRAALRQAPEPQP
ncbi:hypothetical protein Mnod_2378 [Methylobacterium nodulans ORS 2060]|uniref:Uncharacterized protein n=1 Tax=Methylobacterium nodulans (strain LMG 21967 / CNCM I-2342 / ORS 2060) TaxID=460265 RepID=B8IBD8_METNO|nr:hypothetical protein Mnod_2378 [Methylobacterium nodulans ORS 2060]